MRKHTHTHTDARRQEHTHTHTPPGCLHTSAKTNISPSQLISERPKSRFSPQKSSSKDGFIHPCRRKQGAVNRKNTPAGQRKAAKERKKSPVTKLNYAPHVSDKKNKRVFPWNNPVHVFSSSEKQTKKCLKSLLT